MFLEVLFMTLSKKLHETPKIATSQVCFVGVKTLSKKIYIDQSSHIYIIIYIINKLVI